ncbi:MAG: DNA methyltransferase [Fimbriimonadales bacterium]
MVTAMLDEFTEIGDTVLDPFGGSGVVPLQALLQGRKAISNDLSEYAYALTLGKLAAPKSVCQALALADLVIHEVERLRNDFQPQEVPEWVRSFFHPRTLKEVLIAFEACRKLKTPFVQACLLGILHHVRPGFLSYPASHLTPYLREKMYPRAGNPEMYAYRELATRLRAKVHRAYRRPSYANWTLADYRVDKVNSIDLPYMPQSVDAVISSPPYFGALDYARDNRLRLWFLGVEDWRDLDKSLTASQSVYLSQMRKCLLEMFRVLRPGAHCILVLGDVSRNGKMRETAEIIAEEAIDVSNDGFEVLRIVVDQIPDDRRSRRRTVTTKYEKILIMRKRI